MTKKEIQLEVLSVEIENTRDWYDKILDKIDDKFAKGYLTAKLNTRLDSIDSADEEFREDFLEYLTYDIWNK